MTTKQRGRVAALVAAVAGLAAVVVPGAAGAVDTAIAISTTAIDFGQVDIGTTAEAYVTVTNTGAVDFGPINMFGGAPPTAEFDASQSCQASILPAGGACTITYEFSPASAGTFNDASNFTISATANAADGEDFSVSLTGVGFDPGATTTTSTTTTTTTTTSTTSTISTSTTEPTTTSPSATTQPPATQPPATQSPATTTSTSTTTTTGPPVVTWPLTGLGVVARPALVVKVDNVDAEPQSGLNQADIVFEEIVEGRATRFAAVFNSTSTDPVGPVRSARTQDVDLLSSLNDPALVYSGANDGVQAALESAGFELFTEGVPGFFRRDDRPAPHNLYVNLSALWPQLVSSGNAVPAFAYAPPGTSVTAGTPVTFAEMMVGDYPVRWDWDPVRGLFLRSQLGTPHELADGQVSADSVVVLVVDYGESAAGGGPEAQTLGSGRAVVYTDGRRIEGIWTRSDPNAPFALEANGMPILLAPGRTWVELVDEAHNLVDG